VPQGQGRHGDGPAEVGGLHPARDRATLEAELFDGSGSVTLVWLGRRRIPGIEPGRTLTARGRFAAFDGKQVIYNPKYELGAG